MRSILIGVFLALPFLTGFHTVEKEWLLNYDKALTEAQETNKAILLYFSGSDWCKPCILLKKEVLETGEFRKYASENLVLVKLDFPRLKKNQLPKDQILHNEALAGRFNNQGAFPLIVLLDQNEKVLYKIGYKQGGADKYIQRLEKYRTAGDE